MQSSENTKKIAFLAANGVDEGFISALQRRVSGSNIAVQIVSTEKALIQTWSGIDWGYSLAVQHKVDTALSADYDGLIMCGSQRHLDKLGLNPHCARFTEGFCNVGKPVIAVKEAVSYLNKMVDVTKADSILTIPTYEEEDLQNVVDQIIAFANEAMMSSEDSEKQAA